MKPGQTRENDQVAPETMDRAAWGSILLIAACVAMVGAYAMDLYGLQMHNMRPLPVVGALLFLKLGLFTFWPVISSKGKATAGDFQRLIKEHLVAFPLAGNETIDSLREQVVLAKENISAKKPSKLRLWDEQDPRLDLALFHTNVPTMVLNHEQKILDWNPAFALVFGAEHNIVRGAPIRAWYDCLDNFKRVSRRADKLFGEGILPLADRERATYISTTYGRMVFTRVMTPIIERSEGRTIGWTIVLNINSVAKRQKFFEDFYKRLHLDTCAIRYGAAHDGIFKKYRPFRALVDAHKQAVAECKHVLEIGCGTGLLSRSLLRSGMRVTSVDEDVNLLRTLRGRTQGFVHKLKMVRMSLDDLRKLPVARYGAACLNLSPLRMDFPEDAIARIAVSLKPNGILTLASVLPNGGVDGLYEHLRADLEAQGDYDALKLQFDHVYARDARLVEKHPYRQRSREELRSLLIQSGFEILDEQSHHLGGHVLFLKARKRPIF